MASRLLGRFLHLNNQLFLVPIAQWPHGLVPHAALALIHDMYVERVAANIHRISHLAQVFRASTTRKTPIASQGAQHHASRSAIA